jgi:hypothetical protein
MKKILLTVAIFLLTTPLLVASVPMNLNVSNASLMVLPQRSIRTMTAWTTNTDYTQGSYVKNNGIVYWAYQAGTSTNSATATGPSVGVDGTNWDGTVIWAAAPYAPRKGFSIQVESLGGTHTSYFALGSAALEDKGIKLISTDDPLIIKDFQGPVYAITAGGASKTNRVIYTEW